MSFFDKFWSTQENLCMRLFIHFLKYQVMKILLKNLLQKPCNVIVGRVTKELEFSNKYLDWGCVNKWG